MKVLAVIQSAVFGGVHNQAAVLAGPLAERGWEIEVVLPDEPGNAAERLRAAGVPLEVVPLGRLRAKLDPRVHVRTAAGFWPEVRRLRKLIHEHGIDLVQVHGAQNPHGAIAARREGAAVVWQLMDTRSPMTLRRLSMPLVTRLADVVMTTGLRIAEMHPGATSLGDRLVPYVPPVDRERFRPDEERRRAARRELGVEDGAVLVGSVGNLNPQKGHEYLLRAAALARADGANVVVRVLGAPSPPHPEYRAALRAEARELGLEDGEELFVDPGTRVPELMPAFDVFALTAVPRSEGIPTVVLEAMSCALPVVTTDVGAVAEVIDQGRTGTVVAPEQVDAIAAALAELVRDPGARRAMGERARERVLERYDVQSCADTHAAAYAAAVAHSR